MTGTHQAVAWFESDTAGRWMLKLTVSDGQQTGSDIVEVSVAPPAPGGLTASPVKSQGGDYALSWSSVAGVKDYQLWETQEGGIGINAPCLVYEGAKAGTSFSAHADGEYNYFAKACVNGVCSGPSTGVTVYVTGSSGTASACLDGGGGGMQPNVTSATLTVHYHYDANGNLASVTNANTGTVYWQADPNAQVPAVNAWGAPQAWTLGNGIHVQRNQDLGTGAVTSVMAGPGENAATRVSLAYGYGPAGNTTSAMDILTGVSRYFAYDGLNRQTQALIYNSVNGYSTLSVDYNGAGDITSRSGVGSYSYTGVIPHAVTKTTLGGTATHYSYNAIGQMTLGGSLSQIQWSAVGRAQKIVGSQTLSLAYGADGALVKKSIAGTVSRYFGKLYVKIGNTSRGRIIANGEVVAIVNVNAVGVATTDYLVHDAQGSPAALLSASGELVARYAFNAWGELVNPQTGIGPDPDVSQKEALTTLGYTGHEMFWKTGLVHTQARLYSPRLGRWLSPDPTVPNPYNGQAFNRYSYVLNNPATFVDPWGLVHAVCQADGSCVFVLDPICVGACGPAGLPPAVGSGNGSGHMRGGPRRGKGKDKHKKPPPCGKAEQGHSIIGITGFGTAGVAGAVGPIGGRVSVGASGDGIGAEGDLGVGGGISAYAAGGLQYGKRSPASITTTGILSADILPVGIYFQFSYGENGLFLRVGVGVEEGDFVEESPSLNAESKAYSFDHCSG